MLKNIFFLSSNSRRVRNDQMSASINEKNILVQADRGEELLTSENDDGFGKDIKGQIEILLAVIK